ncbi:hypothetical protein COOONC_06959 [Cooperia oncophora]
MKLTVFALIALFTIALPTVSSLDIICGMCKSVAGTVLAVVEKGGNAVEAINDKCTKSAPAFMTSMCELIFGKVERFKGRAQSITPEQACAKFRACSMTEETKQSQPESVVAGNVQYSKVLQPESSEEKQDPHDPQDY